MCIHLALPVNSNGSYKVHNIIEKKKLYLVRDTLKQFQVQIQVGIILKRLHKNGSIICQCIIKTLNYCLLYYIYLYYIYNITIYYIIGQSRQRAGKKSKENKLKSLM